MEEIMRTLPVEEPLRQKWVMYDHLSSDDDFSYDGRDNEEDDLGEQLERAHQCERTEMDERVAHPQISGQPAQSSSSVAAPLNAPPLVEHSTKLSMTYSQALINRIGTGVRPTPANQ